MIGQIMVVDDDSVFRESVERHLGDDYQCISAETLGEARVLLRGAAPECVLLDLRLPDGDGTDIIPELVDAQIPVVMCTARGSEAVAVQALKEGADDYLTKNSLKAFDLHRAIGNAVERARLRATVRDREREKDALIEELQSALQDVKTLSGLIPICAECKKIRDDDGYWQGVEHFVSQHTEAKFSHGFCPDCLEKQRKVFDDDNGDGG